MDGFAHKLWLLTHFMPTAIVAPVFHFVNSDSMFSNSRIPIFLDEKVLECNFPVSLHRLGPVVISAHYSSSSSCEDRSEKL
ncbi:hypothetical protein C5167_040346 [Papaver somniferum]|uniref:Uncharacterized protein n=1 Tax=Papaver somniferum TaxID=3469 RepID=A0A4Y7IIX6_PAPSO|nr:hypothetical protein C5167_040346 [Papaver somniferum]